jgi:hypothetical protein
MARTKGSIVTLVLRAVARTGDVEQQLNVSPAISHAPGHFWPGNAIPPPCWEQVRVSYIPCPGVAGAAFTGVAVVTTTVGTTVVTVVEIPMVFIVTTCWGANVVVGRGVARGSGPGMEVHPALTSMRMSSTAATINPDRLREVII